MLANKQFTRVFDILAYQQDRYPQEKAVNRFKGKAWQPVSISALIEQTLTVACWLHSRGYKKGDTLAIIPQQGTIDWLIIDFACQRIRSR